MEPAASATREAVAPFAAEQPPTATATRRILLAEDHEAMRHVLARALARDGHEVVQARDGLELMRWVEQMRTWQQPVPLFDLLVTDLRMPMYSGQHCLDTLAGSGVRLPVVLISAFADAQVHRQAFAAGARAVLQKPLDLLELRTVVARLLD